MSIRVNNDSNDLGYTREKLGSHLNNLNEIQKYQALKKLAQMEATRLSSFNKADPVSVLNLNG